MFLSYFGGICGYDMFHKNKDVATMVTVQTVIIRSVFLYTLPEPQPHLCAHLLLKLTLERVCTLIFYSETLGLFFQVFFSLFFITDYLKSVSREIVR